MAGVAGGDLLPISLVAHHAFCPRRAWLEAAGERTDTAQMAVGTRDSAPSDDPTASRARRVRALDVASVELGVVGRSDSVEEDEDGALTVVEHKATPLRRSTEVTRPTRIQLALLGAALGDMGHRVHGYAVWFSTHRLRVDVPIGGADHEDAAAEVAATRAVVTSTTAPPPLVDDPRCAACSHVGVCLPDERQLGPVSRRIAVADPDGQVLHLTTQGAHASLRQGRVRVRKRDEELASVPIERVDAVVVHGNVDLSGALLREMLWRSVPVLWVSGTGRLVGWANSAASPNGGPRHLQHRAAAEGRLALAAEMVSAKIANQATLLRRHGEASEAVVAMRALQRRALAPTSRSELLGLEGDAAARYFAGFASMLTARAREREGFQFSMRSRRPAGDPVNAALNYAYGLLLADAVRAIVSCGLDPHAGFLHEPTRNKPALALDLMEELRAPIADGVVIGAINNGELRAEHFTGVLGSIRLRPGGRRALVAAYERRLGVEFVHPVFGYRVTWRRAIEIQARLILGLLDGTQPTYRAIRIR